ncbi:MAG: MarR family transcriptional regulator [Clostridiales bacterium]|nr:MarR family transcriptional regulator [Clostridiales bacterium]MBD9209358.1 MarR family transcriptional regulator [Clostridiales bacterium]
MSESNECRFGREIRIISNLMRRRLDSSAVMTRSKNITGTGGWLLGYLYANRDRDIYQRDVEKEFSIRRATSSKVITRLEDKGFVRRESVDCDARLKKLVLTEEGMKIQRDVCRELDDFDEKLISVLTEDEQKTLFELLGKIKDSLEK